MAFTFYATIDADSDGPPLEHAPPGTPLMLPASSWQRRKLRAPRLPAHVTETAADCGGFVATKVWGDYRYTPAEYVRWLETFSPPNAATMDYCCEPELAHVTHERQARTTHMAYHFWRRYKRVPWVWVPTIQGWEPEDYQRHARELRPLVEQMADYYGPGAGFRVGIGTLCRRASVDMIRRVVRCVASELPGASLHLWGVKLTLLKAPIGLPEVTSVDSAAWNGLTAHRDRQKWEAVRGQMRQREYSYRLALPEYLAKVEQALSAPKQLTLLLADESGCPGVPAGCTDQWCEAEPGRRFVSGGA